MKVSLVLLSLALTILAQCLAVPLPSSEKPQAPKNALFVSKLLAQLTEVAHVQFQRKDGVIRVVAISVIGVFAAAVFSAIVAARVHLYK